MPSPLGPTGVVVVDGGGTVLLYNVLLSVPGRSRRAMTGPYEGPAVLLYIHTYYGTVPEYVP